MQSNSYVYFELTGEDLDPQIITDQLGIHSTESFRKGDKGKYNPNLEFGSWKLSTHIGTEYLMVENLVEEVVSKLFGKIDLINKLKKQYGLSSVLEIVLYIDSNEEQSTPILGHSLKTIEFLYRTQTSTDIDIYRFHSKSEE